MGPDPRTLSPAAHGPSAAPHRAPLGDHEAERAPAGALLLEVSWEVCNQLGGIYQVIRSKAPTMVRRWRQRYYLVGPYNPQKAAVEFEERRPTGWLSRVIEKLGTQGLKVHHGRWLIPGRPKVLLLEHHANSTPLDVLKYKLWEDHHLETPTGNWFVDGAVTFGEAVRRLTAEIALEWVRSAHPEGTASPLSPGVTGQVHDDDHESDVAPKGPKERRLLLHAHEWMAGLCIPALRKRHADLPIATIFTTHATQLGRSLAWTSDSFYDHLPFYNDDQEARNLNVRPQHAIERTCAAACHVFTTVSPITGEECTHLLGRTPDMILPNGLNIEHYNVGHDFQTFHAEFKERIHAFTMGHFFPSYSWNLDDTIYFFTSGRYEPRNKGFDLCLEAMARLNAELKSARINKRVVFFIVTQRPCRSIHPTCMQLRGVLNELRGVCESITEEIGDQLFRKAAAREPINLDAMVSEYWNLRFRRTQHAMTTDRLPPVVTHVLEDDQRDEVLNQVRNLWLFNRPEDPVKIVYHPEFITPTNPLWGIEYEQFVRGCHLGIFPSAYEPWGYTPLECMALGVPAVTSDLSGFGRYVQQTHPEMESGPGGALYILKRRGRSFHDAAANLAHHLLEFCRLDRRERINVRNQIEQRSWDFDWTKLARAYDWAQDLAMARVAAEQAGF
jgi:glycogen(starch) synthase